MLRNLPTGIAGFIGMTGSSINATDALSCGIATHHTTLEGRHAVLETLTGLPFSDDPDANALTVETALDALPPATLPEGEFAVLETTLDLSGSYADVAARLDVHAGRSEWADRGLAAMHKGCATTVGIVVEQLRRSPQLDMAGCFRLEMDVASHCARFDEFQEGVRALIIEKDNAPQWRHSGMDTLEEAHVLAHFEPAWPENPLADMG